MSFHVIKNAKVHLTPLAKGAYSVIVNDTYTHTFDAKSKLAKDALEMDRDSLLARLNGGTFVFLGDRLVDFRYSDYQGFIHSNDGIQALGEKIGFDVSKPNYRGPGAIQQLRRREHGIFLGGVGEDFYLDIAGLGAGGQFKNRILYRWSPFSQNIETTLEVERLICSNGMVGISPLTTRKVPLLNDWERNLEIVSLNLQPTMNALLTERFEAMVNQRATLHEVRRANQALISRLEESLGEDGKARTFSELNQLRKLVDLTNIARLDNIYRSEVLGKNEDRTRTLPSDLNRYDLFNVLTEASTHTSGSLANTKSLQTMINVLVFDNTTSAVVGNTRLSSESDPSRVFFGTDRKNENH
jgi:hypothetical protein